MVIIACKEREIILKIKKIDVVMKYSVKYII